MIQWLYTVDKSLIDTLKFGIVEREPKLQKEQLEYIKSRFGDDVKIEHFSTLDEVSVDYAFFVSNEIFDAFPCELYKRQGRWAYWVALIHKGIRKLEGGTWIKELLGRIIGKGGLLGQG